MQAGRLRHRLKIERQDQSTDQYGAVVKTWVKVAEVQAAIDSVSGREYLASERSLAEESVKITLRELPAFHLDGSYRAVDVDTGIQYDIVSVLDSHYRNMLTLVCRAGTSHS